MEISRGATQASKEVQDRKPPSEARTILSRGAGAGEGTQSTTSTSRSQVTTNSLMTLYAESISEIRRGEAEWTVGERGMTRTDSGKTRLPVDRGCSCCSSLLSIRNSLSDVEVAAPVPLGRSSQSSNVLRSSFRTCNSSPPGSPLTQDHLFTGDNYNSTLALAETGECNVWKREENRSSEKHDSLQHLEDLGQVF